MKRTLKRASRVAIHTTYGTNICRPSEDAHAMFVAMMNIVLVELASIQISMQLLFWGYFTKLTVARP